jgi:uncharacterized cupin superfamily protein
MAGLSAAAAALMVRDWPEGPSLISSAHAQSSTGVRKGLGEILSIASADAHTVQMAEWTEENAPTGRDRIAASKETLARAPDFAARYEAKLHNYPSGSLRVLTYKKGGAVNHQITFESQIYIISGTATLSPLKGLPGTPVTVKAGDALFLPTGVLTNPQADEDFVILQQFVSYTKPGAKQAIMSADKAESYETAQWDEGGKSFSTREPAEVKKAPATAARWATKRYVFEGNSIRVASFKKGGRTNLVTTGRTDVLIYIAKGHFRRKEGDAIIELKAGDTLREKMGNPGYWDVLEESTFIATDAPVKAAAPVTGWTDDLVESANKGTKLFEMGLDHNNRSAVTVLDLPMQKLGEYESISAKQDATFFRIGFRPFFPRSRTNQDYASAAGPFEMHVGGAPHFVARMVGTTENTMQDGAVLRQTAGDFVYVRPGALHHSNQVGYVPGVVLNLFMPGTDETTQPLALK